jgi:hypothetical protein
MIRQMMAVTCGLIAAIGAQSACALVNSVTAVRTYDENTVQTNIVDVSARPFTVSQMTTSVASAFDAGRGGVIDFDNGSFTDSRTIDAVFAGGSKVLRLTNSERDWSIGVLGSSSLSGAISGPNVCFNGAPSPFPVPYLNDIQFGDVTNPISGAALLERVTSFGFTIIDATFNNAGNDLQLTAYFSNGTFTSMFYTIPRANNSQDTFFAWVAPAGTYITHVSFSANNNTASEDWAFVTSPIPEPATAAGIVVFAIFGTLGLRLRSRTV